MKAQHVTLETSVSNTMMTVMTQTIKKIGTRFTQLGKVLEDYGRGAGYALRH